MAIVILRGAREEIRWNKEWQNPDQADRAGKTKHIVFLQSLTYFNPNLDLFLDLSNKFLSLNLIKSWLFQSGLPVSTFLWSNVIVFLGTVILCHFVSPSVAAWGGSVVVHQSEGLMSDVSLGKTLNPKALMVAHRSVCVYECPSPLNSRWRLSC